MAPDLETPYGGPISRRTMTRLLAACVGGGLTTPVVAALAEACAQDRPARPGVRHQTVAYALTNEPNVLNPPLTTLIVEGLVMSLLFPGLLRLRSDGTLEDHLAQSHAIEDGGMSYRFQLRPGLQWEDGQPLTAHDWAFTHSVYVDPGSGTQSSAGWDQIDRVETPDDQTVVVRMKEPFAPILLYVGCGQVLPEHVLSGTRDLTRSAFNRQPVGYGPFKVTRWDTASQIVLEANERYFRGRPRLDQFIFKIVPDAETQLNELRAGEVDIVNITAASLWEEARSLAPDIATVSYDDTKYEMVVYVQYEFLRDVTVRQALDYATPKRDIVTGIMRGLATVAYGDVPPSSAYFDPNVEHHDYDLDRARWLLSQAGFTLRDGVQVKDGRPLVVPIYTRALSPALTQVAAVLKQRWEQIGVRTGDVIAMQDAPLFSTSGPFWNGKDAVALYGYGQGPDPYNYTNWSSAQIPADPDAPGNNLGRYANSELDRLLVQGGRTTDPAARRKVYSRIQQILAHDVPVTFLYWPKTLYTYSSSLTDFRPNVFTGPLWNVDTWS
jgi:peptide/nickel transport system substrate-binding protein